MDNASIDKYEDVCIATVHGQTVATLSSDLAASQTVMAHFVLLVQAIRNEVADQVLMSNPH